MAVNYKALELKLRRIVEKRLREGWRVIPEEGSGELVNEETKSCCLVGAAGIEIGNTYSRTAIGMALGDEVDVFGLEDGFEGWSGTPDEDPFRVIGANIRRIYCDDNGQVE